MGPFSCRSGWPAWRTGLHRASAREHADGGCVMAERVQATFMGSADETQLFPHGRVDIAHFPAGTVTRWILEPGWRWSSHVGSAQGLALCPIPHLGYLVAGRMVISTPDGQTTRLGAGDAFAIPPTHDGWVEGDEPCVRIDVAATSHPGRRRRALRARADEPAPGGHRGALYWTMSNVKTTRRPTMTQVLQSTPTSVAAVALQDTLVELIDLSLQAKQAHWNVVGPNFKPLHEQFDEFTAEYRGWDDDVAERLAAIGVAPDGRVSTVSATTPLDQLPDGPLEDRGLVALVEERVTSVADRVRDRMEQLGEHDLVSQDLLIGVVHGLEKQLWMLRAQRA